MPHRTEMARKVAEVVFKLPPLPENIDRLLRTGGETEQDVRQAVLLIADDPGLCAELLHMANCSVARTKRIETIEDAVAQMGIGPLIQLIGTSYANESIREEFAVLTHLNEYFAHSREISRTCRILADVAALPTHEREMYNVAGLIHDMGRLIIMIASDKTSAPLMGTSWDQMTTIIHTEQDILGMNHCDIGEDVCEKWNFSPVLQEGVLRHHTPLVKDDFSYPGALIFLAHFVATSDFTGEILADIVPAGLFVRLGLTVADFDEARKRYRNGPAG